MIVVIGSIWLRGSGPDAVADGLTGSVARAAAAQGVAVEVIAKVGDDPVGDALLLALARDGVGHVAVLRDAVHRTAERPGDDAPDLDDAVPAAGWIVAPEPGSVLDAADVSLALRYLPEYRAIVAVHQDPAVVREAVAAADWAGAHLVVVDRPGDPVPAGIPPSALVIAVTEDADGFGALGDRLGGYAAAVDRGEDPATAFATLTAAAG